MVVLSSKPGSANPGSWQLSSKQPDRIPGQEWRKVLYDKQGVPDNFVSESFLRDLKKNVNLHKYQLIDVIFATSCFTQQIISIVILILMFIYFDNFAQYDSILFCLITLVTLLFYLATIYISPKQDAFREVKSSIIFLVTGFAMSPILRTLTETISTDTIYAMCTLMMLVHLSFYNYGINTAIVSKPISLNAAFFASVCLASRLSTSYHAFAFLIFAIDIFVLMAILYHKLSQPHKTIVTSILGFVTLLLLNYTFSHIYTILSVLFLIFINFLCPYGFYRMQEYKQNIYGPWDEAILDHSKLYYPEDISSEKQKARNLRNKKST